MPVKSVPTVGWTRGSVAATILLVTQQQRDEIAARVRAEMAQRGWNNPKLAREADLSEKTISRLINGRKDARLDTLERVASAFGIAQIELRGPPLAPLGLGGANGDASQLDRIEAKLDRLLELSGDADDEEPETASSEEAARVLAEDAARLEAAAGLQNATARGRPGTSRVAGRRKRAS